MVTDKTYEQLLKQRDSILKWCEGWKKCQDGSYEQALWNSGYHTVCALITQLEENNGKTEVTSGGNEHEDNQR